MTLLRGLHACSVSIALACGPEIDCSMIDGSARATFQPRERTCEPSTSPGAPACALTRETEPPQRCATSELGGATVAYLIDTISLPPPSPFDAARRRTTVGLDLDHLDSRRGSMSPDASCEEGAEDFLSVEPGVVGVDNRLSHLVTTLEGFLDPDECPDQMTAGCIDARLRQDIRAGELLLALELTDVDSLENDPDVGAALYFVRTEDGAPIALDAAGRAIAGQRVATGEAITGPARGSILDGRLRVHWPELTLPQSGIGYPEHYFSVELRADVHAASLTNGVVAGLVDAEEFAAEVVARDTEDMSFFTEGFFRIVADVEPTHTLGRACRYLSAGYAFGGVPAELAP